MAIKCPVSWARFKRTPAIDGSKRFSTPGETTTHIAGRPCLRMVRSKYQFSVPRRVVKDSLAISCSVALFPKYRSRVAADAGPHDDSELCRQTSPAQRSSNLLQSGLRKSCFKYGAATQRIIKKGIKNALTIRFERKFCSRMNCNQPAISPMPAALNSLKGSVLIE